MIHAITRLMLPSVVSLVCSRTGAGEAEEPPLQAPRPGPPSLVSPPAWTLTRAQRNNNHDPDDHQEGDGPRWFGAVPELTEEQAEAYLKQQERRVMSLLVVSLETKETRYLREALAKEPGNPAVQLMALISEKDFLGDERPKIIRKFIAANPENALGYYLAAADAMKNGEMATAVELLRDGGGMSSLNTFFAERSLELEELYRFQQLPEESALANSVGGHRIPHGTLMASMKDTILGEAGALLAQGERDRALDLVAAGLQMGNQLGHHQTPSLHGAYLSNLIESDLLRFLQAKGVEQLPGSDEAIVDWLATVEDEGRRMKAIGLGGDESVTGLLQKADGDTAREYFLRSRLLGDWKAYQWLRKETGE